MLVRVYTESNDPVMTADEAYDHLCDDDYVREEFFRNEVSFDEFFAALYNENTREELLERFREYVGNAMENTLYSWEIEV